MIDQRMKFKNYFNYDFTRVLLVNRLNVVPWNTKVALPVFRLLRLPEFVRNYYSKRALSCHCQCFQTAIPCNVCIVSGLQSFYLYLLI